MTFSIGDKVCIDTSRVAAEDRQPGAWLYFNQKMDVHNGDIGTIIKKPARGYTVNIKGAFRTWDWSENWLLLESNIIKQMEI